ncbi:hypothetical protein [Clostridium sp. HV4-5-A1G]|uniref:hypothetical protein n=1 Tax=Clostridium sp. HV4-5-A1G TaxID=2004595 RepID=UPI00123BC820|nr:hypothetical protein [Clostridium sp. HV4-5-A1G]KAA8673387.1 hypothetical protein F3O63_08840 [Clostridium sp. HV4-5-A1G]
MEDFSSLIDSLSSEMFQARKVICDAQGSLEVAKKYWKEFKSVLNTLPNDLKQIIDRLLMIDFRDIKIVTKHIDKVTYMLNTLRPGDTVKIKRLQDMSIETQKLCFKIVIVSKMALTAVREFELILNKELIIRREKENRK